MIQMVIRLIVSLIANAIGLLAAAYFLDDFEVNTSSFILAVVIFTAATVILGPLITSIALRNASFLIGGIALVTTFIGLVITDVLTDGFEIDGVSTWFIATGVIWVAALIAQVALPFILAKLALTDEPATPPAAPAGQNLPRQ
jgi:putative membrane protein